MAGLNLRLSNMHKTISNTSSSFYDFVFVFHLMYDFLFEVLLHHA